jgi:hypothetical protein
MANGHYADAFRAKISGNTTPARTFANIAMPIHRVKKYPETGGAIQRNLTGKPLAENKKPDVKTPGSSILGF